MRDLEENQSPSIWGQEVGHQSLRKSEGSFKTYPTIWRTRTFSDGSEVKKKKKKILFLAEYKEETCIPRAPGRQYGITGRETCQERRQYKKKKKSEIRNSVSYSHI